MSDRAERRRAAREKTWEPHDPAVHQTVDPLERLARHSAACPRCNSGVVAERGCEWLANYAAANPELITKAMELFTDEPQDV